MDQNNGNSSGSPLTPPPAVNDTPLSLDPALTPPPSPENTVPDEVKPELPLETPSTPPQFGEAIPTVPEPVSPQPDIGGINPAFNPQSTIGSPVNNPQLQSSPINPNQGSSDPSFDSPPPPARRSINLRSLGIIGVVLLLAAITAGGLMFVQSQNQPEVEDDLFADSDPLPTPRPTATPTPTPRPTTQATASATPTSQVSLPGSGGIVQPTSTPVNFGQTVTPRPVATEKPVVKEVDLPEAGVTGPTLIVAAVGILIIFAGLAGMLFL